MPIIAADEISKSFGTRLLFRGASVAVEPGEKLGFIGPNGSGKSTLFKILAGDIEPDEGRIATSRDATLTYLAQEPEFAPEDTIWSAAAAGNPDRAKAFRDYGEVAAGLADATSEEESTRLLARQSQIMAVIETHGGWGWQHEVESLLSHLGLEDHDRRVGTLSGGERKRVALARALLARPAILLLDEPTNHLDADTTLWLEDYLIEYPGAVLMITHDRYFLDRVVTRMIEVHPDRFSSFQGGYTEYLDARALRAEQQSVEASKRERLVEQELTWLRRSPAARTGKQKARIKRAAALQAEGPAVSQKEVELSFGPPPRLGRTVLDIEGLNKSFGDRTLIADLSVQIRAGERIGVIGPNGAGKTTLLRLLTGEIDADSGTIQAGKNTRIAYFDQNRMDLDPGLSVYESIGATDWVTIGDEKIHTRSYLERFLFPTSTHEMRVGSLSGGERNRLLLARLMLNSANLLILDEPTNDLDLDTLRTLESALVDFGGSAIVVTHDRYFLDRVASSLLVFEGQGTVHRHEGGYDLYRRLKEESESEPAARPIAREKEQSRARPRTAGPRKLSYREQREFEGIEEQIVEAETRRDELGAKLSDPDLYVETPERVGDLKKRFDEAEQEVALLYARWEELERISSTG